jgi:hypothetical protein
MDARHYVMEDWAISSPLTFESEGTESPHAAKEADAIPDEELEAAD